MACKVKFNFPALNDIEPYIVDDDCGPTVLFSPRQLIEVYRALGTLIINYRQVSIRIDAHKHKGCTSSP